MLVLVFIQVHSCPHSWLRKRIHHKAAWTRKWRRSSSRTPNSGHTFWMPFHFQYLACFISWFMGQREVLQTSARSSASEIRNISSAAHDDTATVFHRAHNNRTVLVHTRAVRCPRIAGALTLHFSRLCDSARWLFFHLYQAFWHGFVILKRKSWHGCRSSLFHHVEQLNQSVPIYLSESSCGQHVSELALGVNKVHLNRWVKIATVKQPIKCNSLYVRETCLMVEMLHVLIILITTTLSAKRWRARNVWFTVQLARHLLRISPSWNKLTVHSHLGWTSFGSCWRICVRYDCMVCR